jgi:hypothetical protein
MQTPKIKIERTEKFTHPKISSSILMVTKVRSAGKGVKIIQIEGKV